MDDHSYFNKQDGAKKTFFGLDNSPEYLGEYNNNSNKYGVYRIKDKAVVFLKKTGKKAYKELKELSGYTIEAIKENIPTTKNEFINYLNTHKADIVIIGAGVVATAATTGSVASVLSDPVVRHFFTKGQKPTKDTTYIPPNKGFSKPSMPSGTSGVSLGPAEIGSIIAAVAVPTLTVAVEYVRHKRKNKKS